MSRRLINIQLFRGDEVIKVNDIIDSYPCISTYMLHIPRKSIYECYERPSHAKVSIWNTWYNWLESWGCKWYGVSSYNCMQFTISALVELPTLEKDVNRYYDLYVTKCRSELTPTVYLSNGKQSIPDYSEFMNLHKLFN